MLCYIGLLKLVCGMGCRALKLNGTKFVSKYFLYVIEHSCQAFGTLYTRQSLTPDFTARTAHGVSV